MGIHNGHVIGTAGLLVPILALIAPLGIAPLFAVAALATLALRFRRRRLGVFAPDWATILLGLLAVWAAVSLIWSIDVQQGVSKIPRFIAMLAGGLVMAGAAADLTAGERRSMARLLVAGVAAAAAFLAFERLADMPIYRLHAEPQTDGAYSFASYNRGVTVVALMVWPAVMILWRSRRAAAIALAVGTFSVLASFHSNAAIVGLAIGIIAFAATLAVPRRLPKIMAALVVAFIAASPWISGWALDPARLHIDASSVNQGNRVLPNSALHRLFIWKFTADRIMERPVLGWGMNTSSVIPGGGGILHLNANMLPLHPHNGVLQLWLELGAVGALLGAGLIGWMLMRISGWTNDPVESAACTGLIMTGLVMVCLSYGVWQSWWMASLFFAAVFAVGARWRAAEAGAGGAG